MSCSLSRFSSRALATVAALIPTVLFAGERALIDTTKSPQARMYMVDLGDVRWTGGLMGERFEVCRTVMIPHLWTIFSDPVESHAWENFLLAAGLSKEGDGLSHGPPFNDGDFLKWVEALAQVYALNHDPAIDAQMDKIIEVLAKAQREDGYLHTPTIIKQRRGDAKAHEFEDREHFETYNMGHLMTTACIHFRATGKTNMLVLARKAADYFDNLCKTVPADLARNAICPSHYMGVVELYRTTGDARYLELGKQLIEIRSLVGEKDGSDHNQDRVPFRQMTQAVGHAVRANYLFAGVADVFAETGDKSLLGTLQTLADDVAYRKLYITGMTGALYDGASPDGTTKHLTIKTVHQAYGRDYQLPNLTAYNETCATIGYALWTWRMLEVTGDARYADLFEQSLYNGVLPGIGLEGKTYFYVNALRTSSDFKWPMRWSRTRTPNIKSSFCCPPNVVRTIAESQNYVYSLSKDALWINLYGASELNTAWIDGGKIRLRQETDYPWAGAVKLAVDEAPDRAIAFKLRIPGWVHSGKASLRVNGKAVETELRPGTYAEIKRTWKAGDTVELAFDFKPVLVEANPLVEETVNQVAVRNGPLVYCVESKDLPSGVKLSDVFLGLDGKGFDSQREQIVNSDVRALSISGYKRQRPEWSETELYREVAPEKPREITVKFVPYFAWGNRGEADMSVWLPVR